MDLFNDSRKGTQRIDCKLTFAVGVERVAKKIKVPSVIRAVLVYRRAEDDFNFEENIGKA